MRKLAWRLRRGPIVFLIPVLTYTAAFAAWYAAGFGVTEAPGGLEEHAAALGLAIVAFWWASGFQETAGSRTVLFVEHAVLVIGVNFIIQSLVSYIFSTRPVPLLALVAGSLAGSMLVALEYGAVLDQRRRESRALLIGAPADQNAFQFASIEPFWSESRMANAEAIAHAPVDRIVVRDADWAHIPADALIKRRSGGVEIADAKSEYEIQHRRVSVAMMEPADLVFDPAFRSGRHIMAVQAVYTDLVGLVFLVALSPLLLAGGIAVALFGGPGPVIERIRCTGFQYVPFTLLRFRTLHGRTGEATAVGTLLRALRLANLPQLLNIVRGEMVFFGPGPVREEFAAALMEMIPFYSHVFTVKPGVLGWAQANTPRDSVQSEFDRLEYAFYYIKHGSLALDVEILARTFRAGSTSA